MAAQSATCASEGSIWLYGHEIQRFAVLRDLNFLETGQPLEEKKLYNCHNAPQAVEKFLINQPYALLKNMPTAECEL